MAAFQAGFEAAAGLMGTIIGLVIALFFVSALVYNIGHAAKTIGGSR